MYTYIHTLYVGTCIYISSTKSNYIRPDGVTFPDVLVLLLRAKGILVPHTQFEIETLYILKNPLRTLHVSKTKSGLVIYILAVKMYLCTSHDKN